MCRTAWCVIASRSKGRGERGSSAVQDRNSSRSYSSGRRVVKVVSWSSQATPGGYILILTSSFVDQQ